MIEYITSEGSLRVDQFLQKAIELGMVGLESLICRDWGLFDRLDPVKAETQKVNGVNRVSP